MQKDEAIDYLENLTKGTFLTVNIPIYSNCNIPVTAIYVGKDKEGRYEFLDTGEFILSKDFLEKGKVSIEKEFDDNNAVKIHTRIKKEYEKKHNKNRDVR